MFIAHRSVATLAVLVLSTAVCGQSEDEARQRAKRSSSVHQVTGPVENMQQVIAGNQPTMIFRIVPAATHPAGSYGHGGAYDESNIDGARLLVSAGGFRSFWNVQALDWDPDYDPTNGPASGIGFRAFQARIQAESFANSVGGPLTPPAVGCTVADDCVLAFGEGPGTCDVSTCRHAWYPQNRPDVLWSESGPDTCDPPLVGTATSPAGPLFFVSTAADLPELDIYCALRDPHEPVVIGTFALDVPSDATGIYTLQFQPNETFWFIGTGNEISAISALLPGILEIASCESDDECDDDDACTIDECDGHCINDPLSNWNPATQCCDPATGNVVARTSVLPCIDPVCSLGDGRGVLQLIPRPQGAACSTNDPCVVNETCMPGNSCIGFEDTGPDCRKSRYISIAPSDIGGPSALRVTLTSLHHPQPPYPPSGNNPDMAAFEGEHRWVGPVSDCVASANFPGTYKCARLQCAPYYADWMTLLQGEPVHVTGSAVVPSSRYDIDQLAASCMGGESSCSEVTAEGPLYTARWMDSRAPYQNPGSAFQSQPDIGDLGRAQDALKDIAGRPHKTRVQVAGADMDPATPLSIIDLASVVDAIKGFGYPHPGPTPCDP